MTADKKKTWLGYMESLSQHDFEHQPPEINKLVQLLSPQRSFNSFIQHSIPMVYIVDYASGQYRMMSDGAKPVLGYSGDDFMRNGIDFTISNYHPDDLRLFNEKIFKDRLQILATIPPGEQNQYIFSYSYRIKNKFGKYVNLLQRNCFIRSDNKGNPLLSMGLVINVDHHVASNPVVHSVERENGDFTQAPILIHKKNYYLNEEDQLFSKREIEILKWSAEGLTHKEIGSRLFIAEGTVLQHRKNMLQKSNTKNVAELIAYAARNRLL